MLPDKKWRAMRAASEDQLANTEFDWLSAKTDQRAKVQNDQVPKKDDCHTSNCESNWTATLYKTVKP